MPASPAAAPSHDWPAVLHALEFAQKQYELAAPTLIAAERLPALRAAHQEAVAWAEKARQEGRPLPDDLAFLATDRCPSCGAAVAQNEDYCNQCGLKVQSPTVDRYRWLKFYQRQIGNHQQAGQLALYEADVLRTDAQARLKAARSLMDRERAGTVTPIVSRPPRRPFLEVLLDPKNTQWLLAIGGALFVVGLITWLATLGVFENPKVVASLLGIGNLALLGGGWALLLRTRYHTAGRALTLLACLLLPLNLWFYHVNHLITLEGHLWVAALPICCLYAASARVLKDELFVPIFLGGVTLTGLLLLVDLHNFWEIAAPVVMLTALGLAAIHTERAFPKEGEGPFTRRRFGLAFFWSGHVLLLGGSLLLLGAQIAGDWLYEPIFQSMYKEWWGASPSPVVTETWGKLLALVVVLAAVYAYVWSDLVVRRIGLYLALAAGCLVWAEVLVIELLHLELKPEFAIGALAGTGLLVNLIAARFGSDRPAARVLPELGLLLTVLPVLLGVGLHLRATAVDLGWNYEPSWGFVAALALAAVSARVGAFVHRRTRPDWAAAYLGATAAATLVGFAGLLSLLGLHGWAAQAPWLMLVPLAYVVAVKLYGERSPARPLYWVAHAATAVMLISSLSASAEGFAVVQKNALNLRLAIFFAEASLFYALAALTRPRSANAYLGTAAAAAAVWQLLNYAGVVTAYYPPVFAALGLAILIGYRLAILERSAGTGLAVAAFQGANALVSLAFVAAVLRVLSQLVVSLVAELAELWPLLVLIALTAAAAAVVGHAAWRRWYIVAAVAEALLAVLVLNVLIHQPLWRKAEIFSALVGTGLVVAGLVGLHREHGDERHGDLVDFALGFGCLLVGLPLTLVVLVKRYQGHPLIGDEAAMLIAGLALLAVGLALQLRAPTIAGGLLTVLYLLGMILLVPFGKLQTQALVLTCGGAAVFLVGLALSVFRDRLLALPGRVQRREGVFRVLSWR